MRGLVPSAVCFVLALGAQCGTAAAQTPKTGALQIHVTLPRESGTAHLSGRLIVFMTNAPHPVDVIQPSFMPSDHLWIAAREVADLAPGDTLTINGDDRAVPSSIDRAPKGAYQLMALLDIDHNANYEAISDPDIRSSVVLVGDLDPSSPASVELRLTERRNAQPLRQRRDGRDVLLRPEGEIVDIVSPSLSAFWGRPIHMRQIVIVPPGYRGSTRRYPTAFMTHGFGGNLANSGSETTSRIAMQMANGKLPPMIWVLLEQVVPGGTHEFADSANNGPWGFALTHELIPELEKRYRMDGRRSGRFLTGHSSGGWATAWLQVTYPEIFGGTWSTSPDPVDFHSFTNVDLYSAANLYRNERAVPTPLLRGTDDRLGAMETFAKQEAVLGDYGGQLASFEWVFSPRADDGRPTPLFNRDTGAIDRSVADYWTSRFDICRLLVARASELVPQLRGKLRFIVGTADTFYLDRPVRLLEEALRPLGYDAKFTYVPDRNHFDLYDGGLLTRIAQEMYAEARPQTKWRPSEEPKVMELAR